MGSYLISEEKEFSLAWSLIQFRVFTKDLLNMENKLRTIDMFCFNTDLHSILIAVAVKTDGSLRVLYQDLHFLLLRYRQPALSSGSPS